MLEIPMLEIPVKIHPHFQGLELPDYQTDGASGMDLIAACTDPVVLGPGERALVPTGLSISIPAGYEAQIRPRSGLAIKHGVTLLNTPGTIDSDYRGEIKIILINHGQDSFIIERGSRIAQMVIAQNVKAALVSADMLDRTVRGSGGFGHTGIQ
ncbi:dUTP diphosphatase [Omnitrophica bacterium]|nr:dUTP diphosphatase [Candidatus Omnitrophota bacterium]